MKKIILSCLAVSTLMACNKQEGCHETSTCLDKRIKAFDRGDFACDSSKVIAYLFQQKKVYVFDASHCCCDMTSEVIDVQCNSLGYLGGIAGNAYINGIPFYDSAVFLSVVWQK